MLPVVWRKRKCFPKHSALSFVFLRKAATATPSEHYCFWYGSGRLRWHRTRGSRTQRCVLKESGNSTGWHYFHYFPLDVCVLFLLLLSFALRLLHVCSGGVCFVWYKKIAQTGAWCAKLIHSLLFTLACLWLSLDLLSCVEFGRLKLTIIIIKLTLLLSGEKGEEICIISHELRSVRKLFAAVSY